MLLDSKCFPILESDTTASIDFWKYNRKILAASKSLYTKLTGSSTNPSRATSEIHSNEDDNDSPPKRCCLSEGNLGKLDKILQGVEAILKMNKDKASSMFLNAFECVICKDTMQNPKFSPCCKRIVGCRGCVARWLEERHTCPHCSSSNIHAGYADVHGLEEILAFLGTREVPSLPITREEQQDSNSDFDLPIVNFKGTNTRSL